MKYPSAKIPVRASVLAPVLTAVLVLAGCFGEEKAPEMDFINIRNDSSTEATIRVKLWTDETLVLSTGDAGRMEFEAGSRTVQAEARSRKQWDDCWVTMQVGETLVVSDAGERIGCSVE